jgi:prophage antirepressor-like protein
MAVGCSSTMEKKAFRVDDGETVSVRSIFDASRNRRFYSLASFTKLVDSKSNVASLIPSHHRLRTGDLSINTGRGNGKAYLVDKGGLQYLTHIYRSTPKIVRLIEKVFEYYERQPYPIKFYVLYCVEIFRNHVLQFYCVQAEERIWVSAEAFTDFLGVSTEHLSLDNQKFFMDLINDDTRPYTKWVKTNTTSLIVPECLHSHTIFVNQAGLSCLIGQSMRDDCYHFREWVFTELISRLGVIPDYSVQPHVLSFINTAAAVAAKTDDVSMLIDEILENGVNDGSEVVKLRSELRRYQTYASELELQLSKAQNENKELREKLAAKI